MTKQQIKAFISQHRLPPNFGKLIDSCYSPLACWLQRKRVVGKTLFIGINGAQGAGKSTLADYLRLALESGAGWHVAVLSIDDFYLTQEERERLADRVHPLLRTRGVPGTHDLQMLAACVENLKSLEEGAQLPLPRFDKARDDRAGSEKWAAIVGPVDMIILEGWCVGSVAQTDEALLPAMNPLEEEQDAGREWRQFVNAQLAGDYADMFAQLDTLVFLQVPNFEAVYRWRLEQEQKLAEATRESRSQIMSRAQIGHFIQHYERITRANLAALPEIADVIIELDDQHDCVHSRYANISG